MVKPAAIEAVLAVGASPAIGYTEKPAGRLNQVLPQIALAGSLYSGGSVVLGDDDEETADQPLCLKPLGLGTGSIVSRVVAEADLVQSRWMAEIVGIDPQCIEAALQPDRIFNVFEGADLGRISHLRQGDWLSGVGRG